MRVIQLIFMTVLLAASLSACKTTTTADIYGKKSDEQIYRQAEEQLAKGNYDTAVKDLEGLDTLYPFGEYSQQGRLNIMYAYYRSGDNDSALAAADRYMRLYPRSSSIDYALYIKGLANMGPAPNWLDHWTMSDPAQRDIGNMEEALRSFHLLTERFPNSQYASDARQRMNYIRHVMAQHQLEIAQYYLKRKAYVAAVNRARNVVENYPGTSQVAPALNVMVEAYTQLNEPQMANDARNVLANIGVNTDKG